MITNKLAYKYKYYYKKKLNDLQNLYVYNGKIPASLPRNETLSTELLRLELQFITHNSLSLKNAIFSRCEQSWVSLFYHKKTLGL